MPSRMTNKELQEAIDSTHHQWRNTLGSYKQMHDRLQEAHKKLLDEQIRRATDRSPITIELMEVSDG